MAFTGANTYGHNCIGLYYIWSWSMRSYTVLCSLPFLSHQWEKKGRYRRYRTISKDSLYKDLQGKQLS